MGYTVYWEKEGGAQYSKEQQAEMAAKMAKVCDRFGIPQIQSKIADLWSLIDGLERTGDLSKDCFYNITTTADGSTYFNLYGHHESFNTPSVGEDFVFTKTRLAPYDPVVKILYRILKHYAGGEISHDGDIDDLYNFSGQSIYIEDKANEVLHDVLKEIHFPSEKGVVV